MDGIAETRNHSLVDGQSFKRRLESGKPQIGIRSQICSPIVAEILGFCGFDYVYLDMEHSPSDLMVVLQQCQTLAGTPAAPVIRIPHLDPVLIQRLLDVGIENIVVPMIETLQDAERAAAATRFPPRGIRSFAGVHRGNQYGLVNDYTATVETRICLILQVESRAAVERIPELARVEGVSGILFGPADLAANFGLLGESGHPEVEAAIANGISNIKKAGKFAGMSTGNPEAGRAWIAKGCDFVSIGGDVRTLAAGARKIAAAARN